jgi:predicted Zn-dependent peptidase
VSAEDLEKERGAVLEEYRGGRNAAGRMQDSHWALLFQGSKVLVFVLILMETLQSFCPSY